VNQLVHLIGVDAHTAATRRQARPVNISDQPFFRVSEALRAGASRETLRSSRWNRPFHGVRARAGSLFDLEQVCAAYATKLPAGSLFTGLTAARLWRLPLPLYADGDPGLVHVAAQAPRRAPQGVGVVGSQFAAGSLTPDTVAGLPVISAVDAWCGLAPVLDVVDLTAIADHLLSSRGRSIDHTHLSAAIDRREGERGVRILRSALDSARFDAWSRTETLTRLVLTSVGIPEPLLNHRIFAQRRPFRLDLAWPDFRFAIEYDGDQHRERAQFIADLRRQELIHDESWMLMRVTRADLFDRPRDMVARAARRLAECGCRDFALDLRQLVHPRR
jgi:hypothetical protein